MGVIPGRRRSSGGGLMMAGLGGGVRCATCQRGAPGWSEKKASDLVETVDAIARWVVILVYGSIRDARKWFVRRRTNAERTAKRREAEISLWPEKNRRVGAPRIDDLEGSKGPVWGE